jgi:hypothetical protein
MDKCGAKGWLTRWWHKRGHAPCFIDIKGNVRCLDCGNISFNIHEDTEEFIEYDFSKIKRAKGSNNHE